MRMIIVLALLLGYTSETGQDYTEKMAKYYGHELSYSLRELKGDWLGATLWTSGGCTWTNYLDRREWEDDLWKGVLAHEWAHSFLGKNCIDEDEANKIALVVMARAEEYHAFCTWMHFLKHEKGWNTLDTIGELQDEQHIFGRSTSDQAEQGCHIILFGIPVYAFDWD